MGKNGRYKYANDWIHKVPKFWNIMRIKNLFKEVDIRTETGEEDLLSVSQYAGVTLKKDNLENESDSFTNAESLSGYKKVSKNDLIINIMLAWNGSLGISKYDGITSPAYCVYRCLNGNNPEYFGYLFSTNLFKTEFRKNSTGIIDSRLRLYSDNFFEMYCFVPPKREQDEIVNYIQSQSSKINLFIQKKQRLIELLKEQRQSIINHSVTKGINPDVKMKDSGIEWLGEVPEHWVVRRLKNCVTVNSNYTDEIFLDSDYKISLENIDNWTGKYIESDSSQFEGEGKFFKKGDVLFNKLRPYLAKAFIPERNGFCVGELLVLSPDEKLLDKHFLFQRLMTTDFIQIVNSSTYGTKMPRANWDFIGNLKIAVPSTEEQLNILTHIKSETATIDIAITKAGREIELMKEYKEAMISEAVMGRMV